MLTVRDWLRYAVSRFNAAQLAYGHGTHTAIDEAAYLLLDRLHLPVDDINPWLDARLLPKERRKLYDIVEERISSRKPAAYLTHEAWIGKNRFYVDERVIVPRSYIGELLTTGGLAHLRLDDDNEPRVLDLCTGSGCLAILCALAFENARVDASDVSRDALDVAERNLHEYGLQDRIVLAQGDLFAPWVGNQYDLIVANPPYVADAARASFPPEYAAEPAIAHAGGADGLAIVRRILAEGADFLTPDGTLVGEIGSGRTILEQQYPQLDFLWLDTAESEGEVFALSASAWRV
ncbi:MAG: 50S ribosomal protein L3 N(5)-glutamine methyltransferase [Thermoanaerobaculia bacterium]